ncbi:uncharacterized protein TNCV_3396671 [Trichonephila clavipes]|nr:uncharacterized protein TNCV_3396671 [Trichonephila clavipes]
MIGKCCFKTFLFNNTSDRGSYVVVVMNLCGRRVVSLSASTTEIYCVEGPDALKMCRGSKSAIFMRGRRVCEGCGSPVVKVSNYGRHVMSSIPVPPKTCRVGQRCTLNLSRAETSSRWCGVVVRRGGASSGVVHVT